MVIEPKYIKILDLLKGMSTTPKKECTPITAS